MNPVGPVRGIYTIYRNTKWFSFSIYPDHFPCLVSPQLRADVVPKTAGEFHFFARLISPVCNEKSF